MNQKATREQLAVYDRFLAIKVDRAAIRAGQAARQVYEGDDDTTEKTKEEICMRISKILYETFSTEEKDDLDLFTLDSFNSKRETITKAQALMPVDEDDDVKTAYQDFLTTELAKLDEEENRLDEIFKVAKEGRDGWTSKAESTARLSRNEA